MCTGNSIRFGGVDVVVAKLASEIVRPILCGFSTELSMLRYHKARSTKDKEGNVVHIRRAKVCKRAIHPGRGD